MSLAFGRAAAFSIAMMIVLPGAVAQTAPQQTPDGPAKPTLESVMKAVAQGTKQEVRFREVRSFRRFKSKIVLSGTLQFDPPDKLIRTVTEPKFERTEVVNGMVSIQTTADGPARTGKLADFPTLDGLIGALISVLGGNVAALRKQFAVGFLSANDGWTVRLLPKDPKVQTKVAEIIVTGKDAALRGLVLRLFNGDRIAIEMTR